MVSCFLFLVARGFPFRRRRAASCCPRTAPEGSKRLPLRRTLCRTVPWHLFSAAPLSVILITACFLSQPLFVGYLPPRHSPPGLRCFQGKVRTHHKYPSISDTSLALRPLFVFFFLRVFLIFRASWSHLAQPASFAPPPPALSTFSLLRQPFPFSAHLAPAWRRPDRRSGNKRVPLALRSSPPPSQRQFLSTWSGRVIARHHGLASAHILRPPLPSSFARSCADSLGFRFSLSALRFSTASRSVTPFSFLSSSDLGSSLCLSLILSALCLLFSFLASPLIVHEYPLTLPHVDSSSRHPHCSLCTGPHQPHPEHPSTRFDRSGHPSPNVVFLQPQCITVPFYNTFDTTIQRHVLLSGLVNAHAHLGLRPQPPTACIVIPSLSSHSPPPPFDVFSMVIWLDPESHFTHS